jgi:hypothetical protein
MLCFCNCLEEKRKNTYIVADKYLHVKYIEQCTMTLGLKK